MYSKLVIFFQHSEIFINWSSGFDCFQLRDQIPVIFPDYIISFFCSCALYSTNLHNLFSRFSPVTLIHQNVIFWLLFIFFRFIVILDSVAWNFPATISYRHYFFPILSQLSLWWYNNRYVRLNHNIYPFEYMYFQFQNFCDFHCNLVTTKILPDTLFFEHINERYNYLKIHV